MSKFDDFDNNFNDNEIEKAIRKGKRKSLIRNTIIALVISVITIIIAIIINNIVYIKSFNEAMTKINVNIESTVPTAYASKLNYTQGFLGVRVDYTVSKKVGDRVVHLDSKSESYGINKPLIGQGILYADIYNSEWEKINTWEDGYRKMLFFHPNINYKKYQNDLSNINNMSGDKVIEMAISLDKGYSKDEIADIAFDMRNINTKWIWLDTFSETQMNEFKEEVKNNAPKSCGIIESQVRGLNYDYNNGNIYSGITDINEMYNSWLNHLRDGNENNITNEINKNLYEQLIKDGKDNASNIKILGFIVEGTKEELNEIISKPYIKASTFGVVVDSLY
ncbi:MAG: anti sigma factor C-terminal domain-containing protein [Romboutsia sp.]